MNLKKIGSPMKIKKKNEATLATLCPRAHTTAPPEFAPAPVYASTAGITPISQYAAYVVWGVV